MYGRSLLICFFASFVTLASPTISSLMADGPKVEMFVINNDVYVFGTGQRDRILITTNRFGTLLSASTTDWNDTTEDVKLAFPAYFDDVRIYLEASSDSVTINNLVAHTSHANVYINTGQLNNSVTLNRISGFSGVSIVGGNGRDNVEANDFSLTSDFNVDLGALSDTVLMQRVVANEFLLKTGSHNDSVALYDVEADADLRVEGGSEDDAITLSSCLANRFVVDGDSGSDTIQLSGGESWSDTFVLGGSGNDQLIVRDVDQDRPTSHDDLFVYGESGTDRIDLSGIEVSDRTIVKLGEDNNVDFEALFVSEVTLPYFSFDGSTNNEYTEIWNSDFVVVDIELGKGDDILNWSSGNRHLSARVDGGSGFDRFEETDASAYIQVVGFEYYLRN